MTTQEIEKQREIGKLLLLVEIIHQENDRVANGGISFFSREKLANWSSMKEEEVEKLIDVCESLDTANLPTDAASNKRKEYPVDETFFESKTFEKLLKYYANFMVNRID